MRYAAASRGLVSVSRAFGRRSSVRRPSSSAASTCAALARPTPGTRTRSSPPDRARPCTPPSAASSLVATASAPPRRPPLPSTSATSSLSPSAVAPWRNNFSRGRSAGANSFIYYTRRQAGSWQLSVVSCQLSALIGTRFRFQLEAVAVHLAMIGHRIQLDGLCGIWSAPRCPAM